MSNKYKQIEFEDDIVLVLDENGKQIYKGPEDYEPLKDEDWRWDERAGHYTFNGMVKKCLNI